MGLLDFAEVAPSLACPRCGSPVVREEEGFRCGSDQCALNAVASFPLIGRWPALVDFESSILHPADLEQRPGRAGSGVDRWSIERLPQRLRPLWQPRNQVAASNVGRLLEQCDPAPLVLVVGGATIGSGVEAIYENERARIVAFDIRPTQHVQFIADAHQIPLVSESVDAVLIQAVLEHVLEPARVVREIHRVLRPRGLVYAETPFLQPVHAGPYDFTRFTSSGHRYLFRTFDEIDAGPVAGPGWQMLASVDHLVRGLLRSQLAGRLARAALWWLRYLDRLVPRRYAMDNASAYYFLGRRSEREMSPNEIVGYYSGTQASARTTSGDEAEEPSGRDQRHRLSSGEAPFRPL